MTASSPHPSHDELTADLTFCQEAAKRNFGNTQLWYIMALALGLNELLEHHGRTPSSLPQPGAGTLRTERTGSRP